MRKVKYYYDTDTLSYRKIELNKTKVFLTRFLWVIAFCLFLMAGYQLMYQDKFPYYLIWGSGPRVKHELDMASSTIKFLDRTIGDTQDHIEDLIGFSEQMSKTILQEKKRVKTLEKKIENLKVKVSVTKHELREEISLKDNIIASKDSLIKYLAFKSDSTETKIKGLETQGREYIASITELYEENSKYQKIALAIFSVVLTQVINFIVNKRNSRKRLRKAYEKAHLDKKLFDEDFKGAKEIWAKELVETEKALKNKSESHTRLQLLFNNSEKIVVRLFIELGKMNHSIARDKEATSSWPESQQTLFYKIIEKNSKK